MVKIVSISEHFEHFLNDLKESFWGDLEAKTKLAWKQFLEGESVRMRNLFMGCESYERGPRQADGYRNGYYERDFATRFGTIRLRIARTRGKSFLPPGLEKFQRRVPELAMLIREAFLRGISTRQVGRVVATLTGETVSAQTVSNLTRDLDGAVAEFHRAPLKDEWAYLFLDGVNLKVRRPAERQCVQMLVAYGVRLDGTRQLLAFLRTKGESQADWEALLNDLHRRGLKGDKLLLVVTDGCPGLATALQTVYPRVAHQRCSTPVAGCTRCATSWRRRANAITTRSRPMPRPSIWLTAAARPWPPPVPSAGAGEASMHPWSGNWSAICPSCWPFALFPNTCGASCHHRTLLRRSAAKNPAHGLLRQRPVRGPHHLLHLPEIQPGMEKPHPPRFYTSSLTTPRIDRTFVLPSGAQPIRSGDCHRRHSPNASFRERPLSTPTDRSSGAGGPPGV